MKSLLITSLLLSISVSHAAIDMREHQVGSFEVTEITEIGPIKDMVETPDSARVVSRRNRIAPDPEKPDPTDPDPTDPPVDTFPPDRIEQAGRVITAAKDVVALGEAIYELLNKGRPKITTEYAPISVVPRDPTTKEIVDPFELEGFSMPVEKKFNAKIKNRMGQDVVNFNYKLMYAYGGSYNGTGKYLTGIIIVPGSIFAKKGWIVDSSMKLSGIMNHGSKADPVAGAVINIKYSINSMFQAFERNDTIHVTGRGEMKSYMQ